MQKAATSSLLNDVLTHLAFTIWAVLAAYFYQERLYSDSAFYLAKVIHYEQFWVELSRYVLVFSQWLPLLCVKMGLSMKGILLSYSLGHVLFFYGMYWVGRYRWGSGQLGWLIVGSQTIGITQGFCTPMFELYYISAFLGWWAVLLYKERLSTAQLALVGLLAAWVVVSYMLTLWLLGGMVVLHAFRRGWKGHMRRYTFTVVGMTLGFGLKQLLTQHSYEEAKMEQFILNLTTRAYLWEGYWKPIFWFYVEHYKALLGLVILTTAGYCYQRHYLIALGYIAGLVVTQYIVALTYPWVDPSRYQEQCYFIAVLAVCLPLFIDLAPTWTRHTHQFFVVGLFGVVSVCFWKIVEGTAFFHERVAYLHRHIEAGRVQNVHKLIIQEDEIPPYMHSPSFTFGVESMLLSALKPDARTVHIIRDTEWSYGRNAKTLQDSTLFLQTYRSFYEKEDSLYTHSSAPQRYFNFPPEPYQPARGRFPAPPNMGVLQGKIRLSATLQPSYTVGEYPTVPIRIQNNQDQPLNAAPMRLAYHWWSENGELYRWDNTTVPLEMDILPYGEYEQYLLLDIPVEPGLYRLQLDMLGTGELGWLHHEGLLEVEILPKDKDF